MNAGNPLKLLFILICLSFASPALAADLTVSPAQAAPWLTRSKPAELDAAVGSCPAGKGDDTIYLADNITLDAPLPTIRSTITVTTITIAASARSVATAPTPSLMSKTAVA